MYLTKALPFILIVGLMLQSCTAPDTQNLEEPENENIAMEAAGV